MRSYILKENHIVPWLARSFAADKKNLTTKWLQQDVEMKAPKIIIFLHCNDNYEYFPRDDWRADNFFYFALK